MVRRAFGASGMEKPRRGNDADASRHRKGPSIECAATLSLDPFSRSTLPQTWLAGRRTNQLLRQESGRDANRSYWAEKWCLTQSSERGRRRLDGKPER